MRTERARVAGLRRHQLAYLTAQGWEQALARAATSAAAEPLRRWAGRGLPLVVPRQPIERAAGSVVLAWTSPPSSGRVRVAVELPLRGVAYFHEFPHARAALPWLPRSARAAARGLLDRLASLGLQARVYGSYGWQVLGGETYIRPGSDLDLWIAVAHHEQATAAARVLADTGGTLRGVRIDGELLFPDGAGVAWREYAAWREGRARTLLVKRIDAVQMTDALAMPAWCEAVAA